MDTFNWIVGDMKDIDEEYEMAKGFWDNLGFALFFAVKNNKQIAVSSKHWWKEYYIETNLPTEKLWVILCKVLNDKCGRTMIREDNFIYIPSLNLEQTNQIFDMVVDEVKQTDDSIVDLVSYWQWGWDIEDASPPHPLIRKE